MIQTFVRKIDAKYGEDMHQVVTIDRSSFQFLFSFQKILHKI